MIHLIDKAALVAEIKRRLKGLEDCHADRIAGYAGEISGLKRLLSFLDTLEVKEVEEEPVSNDLEEAASQYPSIICQISPQWKSEVENVFKAGAQWQKEQMLKGDKS